MRSTGRHLIRFAAVAAMVALMALGGVLGQPTRVSALQPDPCEQIVGAALGPIATCTPTPIPTEIPTETPTQIPFSPTATLEPTPEPTFDPCLKVVKSDAVQGGIICETETPLPTETTTPGDTETPEPTVSGETPSAVASVVATVARTPTLQETVTTLPGTGLGAGRSSQGSIVPAMLMLLLGLATFAMVARRRITR